MGWQILSPQKDQQKELRTPTIRRAREKIDFTSQDLRQGWKGALEIAEEMFGRSKGLTLGECKKVLEEIKRRGWKRRLNALTIPALISPSFSTGSHPPRSQLTSLVVSP